MFLKWGQSDQSVPIGSNYFFLQGMPFREASILLAFRGVSAPLRSYVHETFLNFQAILVMKYLKH